jgi:hypothetical protein
MLARIDTGWQIESMKFFDRLERRVRKKMQNLTQIARIGVGEVL